MDLRGWIYSFVNHTPAPFDRPARWIADRVYGVLDDGVKFARWVGKSAALLAAKGTAFLGWTLGFAVEVYTTLLWLYSVEIPRRVLAGLNAAQQWATPIILSVKNTLQSALNSLIDWTRRRINEIVSAATSLRDWARNQISGIKDYLNNTVGKWYDRLTNPAKFAEWIIGAIVSALLRYLFSHREKIVRWMLDSSPAFSLWFVRQLELVLRKLL